ncbi:MAG TPA: aldehyde reductase [Candidatus Binatia bacterium]|nr:aldehyde reductase [Candidatus Binatia bacterium]
MTPISKSAPVLVTGASGYIAGWIVKYLLDEGCTVHATVRDPARKSSVAHLEKMAAGSKGKLKLFKADLLDQGSFDAAMQGCELVMHTASPFVISGFTDANEALVRPALEGTRNVLESVNRTPSVKRVVLTSSVASVCGDNKDMKGLAAFTEEHWNTTSSVDHNPYQYSKVAAEREAWTINQAQKRWDLVTINPSMVYGPSLTTGSQSASIDTLVQMGDGRLKRGVPKLTYGIVDVREVARAHLLAGFEPTASGRHILNAGTLTMYGIARILRRKYGRSYPFPRGEAPTLLVWAFGPLMGPITREFVSKNVGYPVAFDNTRSKQLGVRYRPMEETFVEHFQQVIDDGLLQKRG